SAPPDQPGPDGAGIQANKAEQGVSTDSPRDRRFFGPQRVVPREAAAALCRSASPAVTKDAGEVPTNRCPVSRSREAIIPLQRSPFMHRSACLLAALLFGGGYASASAQDKTAASPKKPPPGVYAVLREGLKEKDVLPLKDGELLVVYRHRYLTKEDK